MQINYELLNVFYEGLDERSRNSLDEAVAKIVRVKEKGGKVMVATEADRIFMKELLPLLPSSWIKV